MLFFCDFIQVYVFTTNHHLNSTKLKKKKRKKKKRKENKKVNKINEYNGIKILIRIIE